MMKLSPINSGTSLQKFGSELVLSDEVLSLSIPNVPDADRRANEKLFRNLMDRISDAIGFDEAYIHIFETDVRDDKFSGLRHYQRTAYINKLIRCADCDNYRCGTCIIGWREMHPNDYCSKAIKKGEPNEGYAID